jgi:hypothetical protein
MLANLEVMCLEKLDYQTGRTRAYFALNSAVTVVGGFIGFFMGIAQTEPAFIAYGGILCLGGALMLLITAFGFLRNFEPGEKVCKFMYLMAYGAVVTMMFIVYIAKVCLIYYIIKLLFFRR